MKLGCRKNREMALNTNKERQEWWEEMHRRYTVQEIEKAIATLKLDTQTVIQLYYGQRIPLQEVTGILQKSMTTVRTCQVAGIYKLWQYFGKPEDHNRFP